MKATIKDIIEIEVIKKVKNHIEDYLHDENINIGHIDSIIEYHYTSDTIEYIQKNGILKKLYMMKF